MSAITAPPGAEAVTSDEGITKWQAFVHSPTLRYVGRRVLEAIPVLGGVSFFTFILLNALPGDAASQLLGANATPAEIHALELKLHLNEPILVRFGHWLGGVVTGNLGASLANGQSVGSIIAQRFPVTAELVLVSFIVTLVLAVPFAIMAARKPRGIFDRLTTIFAMGGISIAQFVFALLLILLFSVTFPILPALGWVPLTQNVAENVKYLVLPVLTIAIPFSCVYARLLRADLLEQMDAEEYVVTARAKGLGRWAILTRHALRNSLIGLVTVVGLNLALTFGITVIVEEIFGLPGIGQALITGINDRDAPLVEGIVLVLAAIVVIANLLTDLLYGVLDPRIRHGRAAT